MMRTKEQYEQMEKIRCWIEYYMMDIVETNKAPEHFNMPREQFLRFFKNMTGVPFRRFVLMRRMYFAARQMRQGASAEDAYRTNAYRSRRDFARAFYSVFGVSAEEYAQTRGRCLMTEPKIIMRPLPFHVVGYPFEAIPDLSWMESGAYWLGQYFPPFDAEEFAQIGGCSIEIGAWTRQGDKAVYVFGNLVDKIGYVPDSMCALTIPGGGFMAFRVPASKNAEELSEYVQATWYYAYEQWLPESPFDPDYTRGSFEYYHDDECWILIPVCEKASKARRREKADKG